MIFGRALQDNLEGGRVIFIDPSLVDDFWRDAAQVQAHFSGFGINNIRHYLQTTQEFVTSAAYQQLDQVGIVFIDGYHSAEQARFDYEAFAPLMSPEGLALFHDSARVRRSRMYGEDEAYEHQVRLYMDELSRRQHMQVLDLPFASGVTLVRRIPEISNPAQG
jgi:predicted O-methyltransferase YrrM